MKKITIYILLIIVSLSSCYKDIGNYKYSTIEDIVVENIPDNLGNLILFEDTIKIYPEISPKSDADAGNFNYYWSIKEQEKMLRFHEGKNLTLPVTKSGVVQLMFEVEHKTTGIIKYITTGFKGTSKMGRGIYLLKETNSGQTDIDMISFDSQTGEASTYSNLLSSQLEKSLEGKPIALDYWGYRKESYDSTQMIPVLETVPALRIFSEKDLIVINTNEFNILAGFEEMFIGDLPTVKNIEAVKTITGLSILINNGQAHCCKSYYSEKVNNETVEHGYNRYQSAIGGDYSLAPEINYHPVGEGAFLTYDNKSSLFKRITAPTNLAPLDVREMEGDSLFYNSFEANMMFMESTATGTYETSIFALLQKREHPDSLIFLDLNLNRFSSGHLTQNNRDILLASNYLIDNASNWCVHQWQKAIYFSVANKLYMYDVGTKQEKLLFTFDDEITHIDITNEYYTVDGASPINTDYTYLIVATSSGNNYTLYKYNMDGTIPASTPYFSSKGEGKIKSYLFIEADHFPASWMKTYN